MPSRVGELGGGLRPVLEEQGADAVARAAVVGGRRRHGGAPRRFPQHECDLFRRARNHGGPQPAGLVSGVTAPRVDRARDQGRRLGRLGAARLRDSPDCPGGACRLLRSAGAHERSDARPSAAEATPDTRAEQPAAEAASCVRSALAIPGEVRRRASADLDPAPTAPRPRTSTSPRRRVAARRLGRASELPEWRSVAPVPVPLCRCPARGGRPGSPASGAPSRRVTSSPGGRLRARGFGAGTRSPAVASGAVAYSHDEGAPDERLAHVGPEPPAAARSSRGSSRSTPNHLPDRAVADPPGRRRGGLAGRLASGRAGTASRLLPRRRLARGPGQRVANGVHRRHGRRRAADRLRARLPDLAALHRRQPRAHAGAGRARRHRVHQPDC